MALKLNSSGGGSVTLDPNNTTSNVAISIPATPNGSVVVADSSGNVSVNAVSGTTGTFSGNVQMASANGGQLAGLRNYLINSGALVTQRGAQAFTNNMAAYGQVDRWAVSTAGFTTLSSSLARSGSLGGSSSTTGYVVAFGATTTTGSGTITFYQRIESVNAVGLNGKTVTISGKLYQDTGSTVSATIKLSKPTAGVDNYTTDVLIGSTFSQSVPTTTNTSFSGQITIGSADATNGLQLSITFSVGAVTNKYFQIADLQLEIGPVATPFEQRPIGMELALCQRYFYTNISTSFQLALMRVSTSGNFSGTQPLQFTYPVQLRATPTSLFTYTSAARANPGNVLVNATTNSTAFVLNSLGPAGFQIYNSTALTGIGDYFGFYFDAIAEL